MRAEALRRASVGVPVLRSTAPSAGGAGTSGAGPRTGEPAEAGPRTGEPAAGAGVFADGPAAGAGHLVGESAMGDGGPAGERTAARVRRRDPWRTAFFVGVVVALAAGVAWALLGSNFFVVRSITVTGSAPVRASKVVAAAGVKLGTPLVRVDTGAVARRVERLTWVQSAKVRRSWPDQVIITTVGRTPVFAVRSGHGYDVIDRFGVVLRRVARLPRGVIWLRKISEPATALRGSAAVHAAGTVLGELPGWLKQRLTAMRAPTAAQVILLVRPGITVVWGGTGRAHDKAVELKVLLRTRATYYDVSDPQSALTGWPGGG